MPIITKRGIVQAPSREPVGITDYFLTPDIYEKVRCEWNGCKQRARYYYTTKAGRRVKVCYNHYLNARGVEMIGRDTVESRLKVQKLKKVAKRKVGRKRKTRRRRHKILGLF